MKKVIQWKQGYRAKSSAVQVHEELEVLRQKSGTLTPEAVLDAAKAENSAMHSEFVWDDTEAGHLFRLTQARTLIRSIEVIVLPEQRQPVRAYSVITVADDRPDAKRAERKVYASTEEALADPVTRDEILSEALRDLAKFRRKYAALSELTVLLAAIDELIAKTKAG
jgi:hypothetical protein